MTLVRYATNVDPASIKARVMVVTLGSFMDAGHTQRILDEHLINSLPHHPVASFDTDALVNYREHRPPIVFDRDHFTGYEAPEIALDHLLDAKGTPFLLLRGVEPDFKWETLTADLMEVIGRHEVSLIVLAQSVPMPVPHTRPVTLTRHASNPSLLPGNEPIFGTMRMGASFPAVLALKLADAGHDVVGLAAHVPHYVTETDFPDAALAVLQALGQVTGLDLPITSLALAAGFARAQLSASIGDSEEAIAVVTALEEQYDSFVEGNRSLPTDTNLPTADEIGAEAEEFLKRHLDDGSAGEN